VICFGSVKTPGRNNEVALQLVHITDDCLIDCYQYLETGLSLITRQ
jgi:hypothetical protein